MAGLLVTKLCKQEEQKVSVQSCRAASLPPLVTLARLMQSQIYYWNHKYLNLNLRDTCMKRVYVRPRFSLMAM